MRAFARRSFAALAAAVVLPPLGALAAPAPDPVDGEAVENPVYTDPSGDEEGRRPLPSATSEAEGLYVEFGRGVRLTSDDDAFSLTIRGRVQARAQIGHTGEAGAPPDVAFLVRRARLVLLGDLVDQNLEVYVQLGLAHDDLEPDRLVPLRDAVVTWTAHRDLNFRMGQMKVNFSRERMISSSSLQLVDRSIVNAELSLDRDVGVQAFSNDLFGWGERLSWQLGVYGGDGRNRVRAGSGLLVAARLQFNPFGEFDDLFFEADLARTRKVRLSLGVAGGLNHDTVRQRSTHGAVLSRAADTRHGSADLLLKFSGFSLQSEVIVRDVIPRSGGDGALPVAALGGFVQGGYVAGWGGELSGRWSTLAPVGPDAGIGGRTEWAAGLGWYVRRHALKVQSDYTLGRGRLGAGPPSASDHLARTQVQVFF